MISHGDIPQYAKWAIDILKNTSYKVSTTMMMYQFLFIVQSNTKTTRIPCTYS